MEIREKENRVCLKQEGESLELSYVRGNIIHCRYVKGDYGSEDSFLTDERARRVNEDIGMEVFKSEDQIRIGGGEAGAVVLKDGLRIRWIKASDGSTLLQEGKKEFMEIPVMKYTTGDEAPVIDRVKTVDGERNFIKNLKEVEDHKALQGRLHFCFADDESIHGLGQAEEGIYDYRHHVQYLYQHNMRIPMPMLVSDRGYGIFFDCSCLMTFSDTENGSYLFFDAIPYLDYYFIAGESMDEIVAGFRYLTGDAAMLPKWAYGYVQSKEQYYTAKELVEVAGL